MKKKLSIFYIIIFSCFCMSAETRVGVYKLNIANVSPQAEATINDVIFSFISQIRGYDIIDLRTEEAPKKFPQNLALDYIFYGSVSGDLQGIQLDLVLQGHDGEAVRFLSKTYSSPTRILLDSRILVESLFDQSQILPTTSKKAETVQATDAGEKEAIGSVDSLAGTWYGGEDLQKVVILRGGRGIAVLATGISVPLHLRLSGDKLTVVQKGPPSIKQFPNIPEEIAKQAVLEAKPDEWQFLVFNDNTKLSGIKTKPVISFNENAITQISYVQEAVSWFKQ